MVSYIMGKESALRRKAEVAEEEVNFKYTLNSVISASIMLLIL